MSASPTPLDHWCAARLANLVGRHPVLDLAIQSAINHYVLGGFLFGLVLFVLWARASGQSDAADPVTQRAVLVILAGSMIAVVLTLVLPLWISWLPPNRMPGLSNHYPAYLTANPNVDSFPSQSVALYAAIAAGVFALQRRLGVLLFVAVGVLVALPRMYVGGHYLSDVLVGAALGVGGSGMARWFASRREFSWVHECRAPGIGRALQNVVVFTWILQVAVEFRDAAWVVRVLQFTVRGIAKV